MSEKILVPALGESVTEATVSKWLKNQGDEVTSDEPVVELETDKVNVEVPAPSSGTIKDISIKEGQTVNVGTVLGIITENNNAKENSVKEIKNYSPPPKKEKTLEKKIEPTILKKEKDEPKKILKQTDFDILHLHSSKAGIIGRYIGLICGFKKIIYTPNAASFLRTDISPKKKRAYQLIEKFYLFL